MLYTPVYQPADVNAPWRGGVYPGFSVPTFGFHHRLEAHGSVHITLSAGDLLHLTLEGAVRPHAAAFDARGGDALFALGLSGEPERLDPRRYDSEPLQGWRAALGDQEPAEACGLPLVFEDMLILKAAAPCDLWLIAPTNPETLVSGGGAGAITIAHRPAVGAALLPPPLGEVRDEFTINRATAQAYTVKKGEVVQIIDVAGRQCSDFAAFRAADLAEGREVMIDGVATRSMVGGAYPGPGLYDKFFDTNMRPMLNVVQDTVGRHDTFALACTARGYEERGFPGHVNCSDNLSVVLAPHDVQARRAWPAINLFFNSWIDRGDNRLSSDEAWSRPGDYVAMRAMDDLVCASTACPDDIDPINGWNPTDIHIRIYRPDAPIRRAVAHRAKEDAVPSLSAETPFHPRTSALTHRFAAVRDVWAPSNFAGIGAISEYWACREAATLMDMCALRKFDIKGPDAEKLLDRAMTRDVNRLAVNRGTYALMCDETGAVIDDGTLFRLAPQLFRWCCGSEESERALRDLAQADGLRVWIDALHGALPNLALQGPKSRDILKEVVFTQPHQPSLEQMKWFGCGVARMHNRDGAPFLLTRTGFTGELGYEIFCDRSDALGIWDSLMAAGGPYGLKPMGGDALELLRVEAGLMSPGAEFGGDVDAYEAGLGFAVDLRKPEFVGKAALERIAAHPRRRLVGLLLDSDDAPRHGDPVFLGERQAGVITSAVRSPTLRRAVALARVAVERSEAGMQLEVGQLDGRMKRLTATVCAPAFVDPRRTRARG